jgi:hypothetical protein
MSTQERRSSKPRVSAPVSSKLNKNLATYMAAAGAAGVSILAMTAAADAKVIYTSTYLKLGPSFGLDLNHDGTVDASIASRESCISGFSRSSLCNSLSQIGASGVIGNELSFFGRVVPLRTGAQIGLANQFIPYGNIVAVSWNRSFDQSRSVKWLGSFANGGHGVRDRYIGIKFKIGDQTHYGWARISVSIPNSKAPRHTTILTGYAYETEPNTAIIAGATSGPDEKSALTPPPLAPVQQPARLGLLARGTDGIAIWRREEETISR